MSPVPLEPPPELVAASDHPVVLRGSSASVIATVHPSTRGKLARAAEDRAAPHPDHGHRVFLNVEDISAARNPGVVYGVYLNLPEFANEADLRRCHVGMITTFGIEVMNEPAPAHEGVPGLRHTFDVTRTVRMLQRAGRWHDTGVTVTFRLELPEPPPGFTGDVEAVLGEQRRWAQETPIRVGRVSFFVG